MALVQSVLMYYIPIWGGAVKTHFLMVKRVQCALIKVIHFKNRRYPTESLYQISNVLSVRKLCILQTVLKMHKSLPYDSRLQSKRKKDIIALIPQTKSVFASRQFNKRSAYLYNLINNIYRYTKTYYESKKNIINWLKSLTYDDTEALLEYIQ